jgi:hypothetical protein
MNFNAAGLLVQRVAPYGTGLWADRVFSLLRFTSSEPRSRTTKRPYSFNPALSELGHFLNETITE